MKTTIVTFFWIFFFATSLHASEIVSKLVIVDSLDSIELDRVSARNFQIVDSVLTADVSSGGGCKDHVYTLYVSRKIKESFPPRVPARLTLDKDGDKCKAIVDGQVSYDLSTLDVIEGPFVLEVDTGIKSFSILVAMKKNNQENLNITSSTINFGSPEDFGDPILGFGDLEVFSGIDSYWAKVDVSYGGGCEKHDLDFWWDKSLIKTVPPKLNIVLVHQANGDTCKGLINETVSFNLRELSLTPGDYEIEVLGFGTKSVSTPYSEE